MADKENIKDIKDFLDVQRLLLIQIWLFLKGMDFLANDETIHAYISFTCAFLNFLAGMRFAIASLYNRIKKLIK